MKPLFLATALCLLAILSTPFLFAQTKTDVLTNASIIKLRKADLDDDIIVSKIQSSACNFDLSENGLVSLKNAGLSSTMIRAMMDKKEGKPPVIKSIETGKQSNAMPVPENLNEVNFYDRPGNALKALPKVKATQKSRITLAMKSKLNLEVDGEKAALRIPTQNDLLFLVNLESAMGDPSVWFTLYKLDVKNGKRTATYITTSGLSGKSSSGKGLIAVNTKKVSGQTFQISFPDKLEKGEYMFFARGTMANYAGQAGDAFEFGLD